MRGAGGSRRAGAGTCRWDFWLNRRAFLAAGAGVAAGAGIRPVAAGQAAAKDQPDDKPGHQALVIAVGRTEGAQDLPHVIEEARGFVEWLVHKARVPRENITLLVSRPKPKPAAGGGGGTAQAATGDFHGVTGREASGDAIIQAVERIGKTAMGPKDRLYFYFTGHGIMFPENPQLPTLLPNDAIASADHDWSTKRPISIRWIQRWFEFNGASEQFLIIDACRELGARGQPRTGDEPEGRPLPLGARLKRQACVQNFLYPVQPEEKAYSRLDRWSFGQIFLDGLRRGRWGAWKQISLTPPPHYVVCWRNLLAALKTYFDDEKTRVEIRNIGGVRDYLKPHFFTLPLGEGYFGDGPVMTELDPTEFETKVAMTLAPPAVPPGTRLVLSSPYLPRPRELMVKPGETTLQTSLPKGTYFVDVQDGTYSLPQGPFALNLIGDRLHLPIDLDKSVVPSFPQGVGKPSGPLKVTSPDPYSQIVVFDAFQRIIQPEKYVIESGKKSWWIPRLDSGPYLACVYTRQDVPITQSFDVYPSTQQEIDIALPAAAPSSLFTMNLSRVQEDHGSPRLTDPSPQQPASARQRPFRMPGFPIPRRPSAFDPENPDRLVPEPPTIETCPNGLLAQVLLAQDRPVETRAEQLAHAIGLGRLPGAGTGIRVVIGAEEQSGVDTAAWFDRLRVSVRPLKSEPGSGAVLGRLKARDETVPEVATVAAYAQAVPNGPYVLGVQDTSGRIEFPLLVLDGRRCDVVLYRNAQGRLTFSQFNPAVTGPKRTAEDVRNLSRLQCDLTAGQSVATPELLDALRGRLADPIVQLIDACMSLRQHKQDELRSQADELIRLFPSLPDGYVIRGLIHETDDPEGRTTPAAAAAAYATALNAGLPLLLPFFEALWDAVRRDPAVGETSTYQPQLNLHAPRRVPYQLWSAWRPGAPPAQT